MTKARSNEIRKSNKKKQKSSGTFASYDEFAHLLEGDSEDE